MELIDIMTKYQTDYKESLDNKIEFWNKAAKEIKWIKECSVTMDNSVLYSTKWFVGSQINMCYNCVDRHVEEGFGDQTAVIYDSPITGVIRKINYKQLQDSVSRLAGVFAKLGVRKGDCILIYMPMIPEILIAMLACARLGIIHSVTFGGSSPHELSLRIKHCEPKLILSTNIGVERNHITNYTDLLNEAIILSGFSPKNCIIYNRPGYKRANLLKGRDFDLEHEIYTVEPHDPVPVDGNHPLYILYTSGSTGSPKGVLRPTAGHAVFLKWYMKNILGISPGETYWSATEIGLVGGHSNLCYGPLLQRCTTVIYEGKAVGTPDASQYFRVLNNHNVVSVFFIPTALRTIRRQDPNGTLGAQFSYPNLRYIFTAGEHCDEQTLNWARSIFKVPILNSWGQTEMGGGAFMSFTESEEKIDFERSMGYPFHGFDVKILDPRSRNVLGYNEIGHIAFKLPLPPGTFTTLYKNEQRSKELYFTKFPGYYDTMDVGMQTRDGQFIILGRDNEILDISGFQISSIVLEEACLRHSSVAECVVVGLDDSFGGQTPLGMVVLNSKAQKAENVIVNEIIKAVQDLIGSRITFRNIIIVNKLPRFRYGKLPRRSLGAMANGKPYEVPVNLDDPTVFDTLFKEFVKIGLNPSLPNSQINNTDSNKNPSQSWSECTLKTYNGTFIKT